MQGLLNWLWSIGSVAAVGAFSLMIAMRDKVNDHDKVIYDRKGENGLIRKTKRLELLLKDLNEWKIAEQTIDAVEKELRRDSGRLPERLRDKLHEDH